MALSLKWQVIKSLSGKYDKQTKPGKDEGDSSSQLINVFSMHVYIYIYIFIIYMQTSRQIPNICHSKGEFARCPRPIRLIGASSRGQLGPSDHTTNHPNNRLSVSHGEITFTTVDSNVFQLLGMPKESLLHTDVISSSAGCWRNKMQTSLRFGAPFHSAGDWTWNLRWKSAHHPNNRLSCNFHWQLEYFTVSVVAKFPVPSLKLPVRTWKLMVGRLYKFLFWCQRPTAFSGG